MRILPRVKPWHLTIFWSLLVPSQAVLNGLLGGGSGGGLLGTGIGGDKGLLGTGLLASGGKSDDSGKTKEAGGGGLLGTGLLGGGSSGGGGLLGTGIGGDKGLLGTGLLASGGKSDDSGKTKEAGGGGLLGTGLLGGGSSGGGGLLGGLLGNTTGALLGGDSEKGGLLGGVLGDKGLLGGGLLGKDGLLGDKGLLGGLLGKDGLLGDKGLLGGLLGKDGLLGGNLLGLGGLLGGGQSKEPFKWFNALNLEIVRGSWKILPGPEIVLNLQSKVTANFPGLLKFLSGSSVEMNITSHVAVAQKTPGDLQLVLKNCKDLVGGLSIKLPSGLLASLVNGFINIGLRTILPTLVCPLFQIWFGLVNMQLHILNDYVFLGLLGKLQTALSSVPFSTGQFSELDFTDKPFPGVILEWLLKLIGPLGSQKSS